MQHDHEPYMRLALDEANRSGEAVNRAVGAVIVHEGKVVGQSGNRRESLKDPTAHAEVMAIREAARNLGRVDLSGCTLYSTLEPCPMCCGAVIVSNISSVVVGARHPAEENRWGEHTMEKGLSITGWDRENRLVTDVLSRECLALLQKWDVRRSAARDQG